MGFVTKYYPVDDEFEAVLFQSQYNVCFLLLGLKKPLFLFHLFDREKFVQAIQKSFNIAHVGINCGRYLENL